jgi:hypothetical protein
MPEVDTTPARGNDWAVQTADTIERLVESVRSNTADRLVSVTRLVVFGLLAAILSTAALILFAVGVVRGLVLLLGTAWAAHLVLGGLFTLVGLFLWQQAWKRPDRER